MERLNIKDCLEKISYQIESLGTFDENVPSVHIDTLKANIIKLYDEVLAIERAQSFNPINTVQEKVVSKSDFRESEKEEVIIEDNIRESEIEEVIIEDNIRESEIEKVNVEDDIRESEKEEVIIKDDTRESEIEDIDKYEIDVIDEVYDIEEIGYSEEEPTLFGTFRQTVNSFNKNHDDLNSSYQSAATIADTVAVKQLKDIKQSIGIGDKFLFINELFSGNVKEYTDSILALNDCQSFEESMQIIEPLQEKYSWKEDTFAVSSLINIVKRRFA